MHVFEFTVRPSPEITIKARGTRNRFLRQLRTNLTDALKRAGFKPRVRLLRSRYRVLLEQDEPFTDDHVEDAQAALARVFGVSSFSHVMAESTADFTDIVETGAKLYQDRVAHTSYAVRCRRTGTHPFTSVEVERTLGAALKTTTNRVNLTQPEQLVAVEVEDKRARFLSGNTPGAGGLPLGTAGRAVVLLSGGYDSIVAAWYLMKRGVEVDFVHLKLAGSASERLAIRIAKRVSDEWAAGTRPDLYSIDFLPVIADIQKNTHGAVWQVLLKRAMLKAAEFVADTLEQRPVSGLPEGRRSPVDAIITGEAVGQVSSQTLSNLRTIDAAASRPIFRPLIGFDKLEIIRHAEHIGTADLSAKAREDCNISAGRPATITRIDEIEAEEARMNPDLIAELCSAALEPEAVVALRVLQEADLGEPFLTIDTVPEGAVLVDCRPHGAAQRWQPPTKTIAHAIPDVLLGKHDAAFDKEQTYVLFCPIGTQSIAVAEYLQNAGVEAYSFTGGVAALKQWFEQRSE